MFMEYPLRCLETCDGVFVNRHLIIFVMRSYNHLLDYRADNKQHVPIVTKFILYKKTEIFFTYLKIFFSQLQF